MTETSPEREGGAPTSHLDDGTLSAHLDRELDARDAHAVTAHLEGCRSCHQRFESLSHAAKLAGHPFNPMPPATRRLQLERAIGRATAVEPAGPRHRHRRRLQAARWAAALVIVAGGGVAFWHFHSNLSGGVSSGAGPEGNPKMGTQHSASFGAGAVRPALQVRLQEGVPFRGCGPPSSLARTAPPGPVTVYDASASVESGKSQCAKVGKLLFRIDRVTSPRVQDGPGGSFATIVLTVPASSADIATSQMLGHGGRKLAVVAGDELVGYLSSVPAPTRVTIGRVPAGLARKLAADL